MTLVTRSVLADQVFGSFMPRREFKLEALAQKPRWNDVAAFEHQLRFRAEEQGREFEQRRRSGDAIGHAPCLSERRHKLAIGERVGRGQVDGPIKVIPRNEEFDGASEVKGVNPRNKLAAVALCAPQAETNQIEQKLEGPA